MKKTKLLVPVVLALLIFGSFSAIAYVDNNKLVKIYEKTLIVPDVQLRPGVTSDMEVIVWSNQPLNTPDKKLLSGRKILSGIPGWENTAHIWEETAKLKLQKGDVKYFVGINMPAGYVTGDLFGNINLADDANATLAVMEALQKNYGAKKLETLYSHSQGCSVVAKTQMNLKEQSSSLKKKFGVKNYEFVACAPIDKDASWQYAENLNIQWFADNFMVVNPKRGVYVKKLDYYNWTGMFFMNSLGEIQHPPTFDQYNKGSVEAPFGATSQLTGWRLGNPAIGEPPFVYDPQHVKMDLPPGLFENEKVNLYHMNQDGLGTKEESNKTREFLTGVTGKVIVVDDPGAVHSVIVTNPRMIFEPKKLPFKKTVSGVSEQPESSMPPEFEEELPEYPEEVKQMNNKRSLA